MATVTPRHVLCVLGSWKSFGPLEELLDAFGQGFLLDRDYSQLEPDERMPQAFEASHDRVNPSMTDDDWEAVRNHRAVAYILSPPLEPDSADEMSGQALLLVATLLRAGGVAAKGESSGIAHGRARWLQLAEALGKAAEDSDLLEFAATLYGAWVRRPLGDEDDKVLYTCGMHLLGQRDLEIDWSTPIDEALGWVDLLGLSLLTGQDLGDGEAFQADDDGPSRTLRFGPCERYAADDFLFNPYGYIRIDG